MDKGSAILRRGMYFVHDNPQIIYTLFLVIAIPVAFFWTNERFATLARDSQDRLEYTKISYLHDGLGLFVAENFDDPKKLTQGLEKIAFENKTMIAGKVLRKKTASSTDEVRYYPVVASMSPLDAGEEAIIFDQDSNFSFDRASDDAHHSYFAELLSAKGRYWRSVRAIMATSTDEVVGYLLTEMSMSDADNKFASEKKNAYIISFVIILAIMVLLGRQARIIDYASLYQKLKDVDRMKDDFVSMAAHELRSPLTVIRGYTEMIDESETLSPDAHKHLGNIDRAAVQLNTLIGDILDVAKLQEGRLSFAYADVDVSTEIEAVVTAFLRPAKDKGLTLNYERTALPLISVDIGRFHQVMVNFIGNAIKYTPSGSVHVTTSATEDTLSVRISDTGMGISADDQKKLFQKFYRVKGAETSGITGTGLGLWITQEIVKSMHGTIAVESIKGKGTDFIVSFPIVKK